MGAGGAAAEDLGVTWPLTRCHVRPVPLRELWQVIWSRQRQWVRENQSERHKPPFCFKNPRIVIQVSRAVQSLVLPWPPAGMLRLL